MQALREYQIRAIAGVHNAWQSGHRSVLLVLPTGGGKTRVAEEIVYQARAARERVLFLVHRRELLLQTYRRLQSRFGVLDVGLIAPGESYNEESPIQVATVQTLIARKRRPPASLIIYDEAHHYLAEQWGAIAGDYSTARALGLTATPERSDGKPLGDMFDELVVGAQYSELIREGHLVDCHVYRPKQVNQSGVVDPVPAYKRYAEDSRAFLFCSRVEHAHDIAAKFTAEGIAAAAVEGKTKKVDRDERLAAFAEGSIRVITNVAVLTEGVDVPQARTCILLRNPDHDGPFLQIAGRVLRPHESKPHAILIDLAGATLVHGFPTEDRIYRLDGKAIERTSPTPIRTCQKCGATFHAWIRKCPMCGFESEPEAPALRFYDSELEMVYAGANTPTDAKQKEYERLRGVAKEKGWSIGWVVREYKRLFAAVPSLKDVNHDERRAEFNRIDSLRQKKNYKPGFTLIRYKETFGSWPPREWRDVVHGNWE